MQLPSPDFLFMPLLPNAVPDINPVRHLSLFTTLNLTSDYTPNLGPNPSSNSGSNAGPTTRHRTARKKPVIQTPARKPRKAGPQSRQGK